jgi:hypothetical protein
VSALSAFTARLDRIDWNFPQAGTATGSIHKAHWFPGNFIPQIPAALIEMLSNPGDVVLDPFGGSGTTVLEAARLGRRSIYSDAVSACVTIARTKIAAATEGVAVSTITQIEHALMWDHACYSDEVGKHGEGSDSELEKWYHPQTLAQLRYIWQLVERQTGADQETLLLLFSDLLFSCASTGGSLTRTGKLRRHHWGWIADNVAPKELARHDAVVGFRNRLHWLPPPMAVDHVPLVLQGAAQSLEIPPQSVDIIVTSPPYVGVIDYVKANRLLYLWMNWPFDQERAGEIGARYKRRRPLVVAGYLQEMAACWREFHRVLKPGGVAAIVIGESRAFPGTCERTIADLDALMPVTWGPTKRVPTRRRVAERAAREALELVLVAEKR